MYWPFFYDWTYILLIPALILSMWAQFRVSSTFNRFSKVRASSGMTATQMAEQLLHAEGVYDVSVERTRGNLTDHYDPKNMVLRLSDSTANSTSVAALGVAAHEAGHVLQHRDGYAPLMLRTAAVPVVNIGSNLSWPLFVAGLIFSWEPLLYAGIALFALAVLFALIRGFRQAGAKGLGSFWVDMVRIVMFILIPLNLALSLVLAGGGVIQGLGTYDTALRITQTRGRLAADSPRKAGLALALFERHVDAEALLARLQLTPSGVVTPLMFEHGLIDRARAFEEQLRRQGTPVEAHYFEGLGHPLFRYRERLGRVFYDIREITDKFLFKLKMNN